jgi:hypothetical protein
MARGHADQATMRCARDFEEDVPALTSTLLHLVECLRDRVLQGIVLLSAHAKTHGTHATVTLPAGLLDVVDEGILHGGP